VYTYRPGEDFMCGLGVVPATKFQASFCIL
jgi:hypothetical protein